MNQFSENEGLQKAAVSILEQLGWNIDYAFNEQITPSYKKDKFGRTSMHSVILPNDFYSAVKNINPWCTQKEMDCALDELENFFGAKDLLQINKEKYALIREGIQIETKNSDGSPCKKTVHLIDWEHPQNSDHNIFRAVQEFWVTGANGYKRRCDIIGFVNGIPLLFVELKRQDVDVENAYNNNYKDYLDTIPQIFHFNAFLILSNGLKSKCGTLGSKFKFFHEWKRLSEEDETGSVELPTMLKGMCAKENFLEIVRFFILYDTSNGKTSKILARNHQYLGVKKALEAYKNREFNNGKLGVFWHTQGSGKSYSMVFLAKLIRECCAGSPTIVIITDRHELNKQISETFENCGLLNGIPAKKYIATSNKDLLEKLKSNNSFIFTLIHKFNKTQKELQNKQIVTDWDIVLMSDEAHRTQNGFFANNMVDLLPRASRIGFTGTPLLKNDEITARTFGGYVSVYDFKRAVDDHATVPLFYENRGAKIENIEAPEITNAIRAAIAKADFLGDDEMPDTQKEKIIANLEKEFAEELAVLRSDKLLEPYAKDFVEHYTDLWQCGKAMFVCLDKITCVKMYNYAQKFWQEKITQTEELVKKCKSQQELPDLESKLKWLKETQMHVVVSQEQNEIDKFKKWGLDIEPHRKWLADHSTEAGENAADRLYKDENSTFRIVFVCAMWLTGFDCPSLSCLYLYKPLEAHTLMQTIARANRVNDGKENGMIVDYIGIDTELREALAAFTIKTESGKKTEPTFDKEELLKNIRSLVDQTEKFLLQDEIKINLQQIIEMEYFDSLKAIKNAANKLLQPIKRQKTFSGYALELERFSKYATREELEKLIHKIDAIKAIHNLMLVPKKDFDYESLKVEINEIINEYIEVTPDTSETKFDISKINFELLRKAFAKTPHKNLAMRDVSALVQKMILKLAQININRIDFLKRYQEIIEAYNKAQDKAEIERLFDELMRLAEELNEEQVRYVREGFDNDEQLAIYDLLFKENLSKEDIKKIKKLAKEVLARIKAMIAEFNQPFEKRETIAQIDNAIRNILFAELPDSYGENGWIEKQRELYDYFYEHYKAA